MPLSLAGPPPPTLSGAGTAWRLDLLIVAVVVAAAGGYLAGMVAARRRGRAWPVRRAAAFLGLGLGGLAVIGLGWPAAYAPALFSVYALRLVLLLMVVPLLVALGRPLELAMTALSDGGAARLRRLLDSRPAKVFTVPVVSPLLLAVVPFVLFFTPWYPATLRYPVLGSVTDVVLLAVGIAVLVPLWEAGTINARVPYAIALLFAFIELLADAVPGIVIRLDTHVIAAADLTGPGGRRYCTTSSWVATCSGASAKRSTCRSWSFSPSSGIARTPVRQDRSTSCWTPRRPWRRAGPRRPRQTRAVRRRPGRGGRRTPRSSVTGPTSSADGPDAAPGCSGSAVT